MTCQYDIYGKLFNWASSVNKVGLWVEWAIKNPNLKVTLLPSHQSPYILGYFDIQNLTLLM